MSHMHTCIRHPWIIFNTHLHLHVLYCSISMSAEEKQCGVIHAHSTFLMNNTIVLGNQTENMDDVLRAILICLLCLFIYVSSRRVTVLSRPPSTQLALMSHLCPIIPTSLLVYLNPLPSPSCLTLCPKSLSLVLIDCLDFWPDSTWLFGFTSLLDWFTIRTCWINVWTSWSVCCYFELLPNWSWIPKATPLSVYNRLNLLS